MKLLKKTLVLLLALTLLIPATLDNNRAEAASASDMTNYAKRFLGTPYVYGGTSPSGFDCSGFVQYVMKNSAGISLPRTTATQYGVGTSVSKSNLQTGDLVFFNTFGSGVSHVGIYIGNSKFIHAHSYKGINIDSINDPYYWGSKYVGAKRVGSFGSTPTQTAQAAPSHSGIYADITKDFWAYDEIAYLKNQGIMYGKNGGTYFRPYENPTRAEVASYLVAALGLEKINTSTKFSDVPSDYWARGAINAVNKAGIITGDQNGNFRPTEKLSREHMALIFTRAFDLKAAASETEFTDLPTDHYAYGAIQALAASGITTGKENGSFAPRELVNRSQFAAFLTRTLK
ncbi:C40 family peptidase [Jeotgalibacillus salarius]|uniref:Hydrolase Nlp/P60 n=1 Tax=Jeotgalibacillus salarius TaxID=546023 RepID=A0A4Y8LLR8_9BACL|nr:C40 family peptidase [Jeotgalibacillus salarius]TFE03988.1 hydrolase Nlp/P60 [Jeotgalibacillus salarius]